MSSQPVALEILGGAELRGLPGDEANRLMVQPKVVGLLSYLAIAGAAGRYLRRDSLAALFWPEQDQAHARTAVRKALHSIRGALGADAVLSRGDEDVALAAGALACDAVQFTKALDEGRLALALEMYRGDLLPGFHIAECDEFDRWLDGERSSLREQAGAGAVALAQSFEADSSYTMASAWARRAARYSWGDERILRRAMMLLERAGNRSAALALFAEFETRLRSELDAEPSTETMALVAQMRRKSLDS